MKVELISHTPKALTLLLRTKNTRLGFAEDPDSWSAEKQIEHLRYMLDTIKSSWEFVDYVFEVSGVSRAFTHQFVRTRQGSYAQESQRTVDVRDNETVEPEVMDEAQRNIWLAAMDVAFDSYGLLIDAGMPVQDARGVLPTATATSIIAKFNLRTLHEMSMLRLCVRTQGEYQDVFRAMREAVIAVHPWAEDFLQVHCVQNGTCAFPRYGPKSCPVWDQRMDLTQLKADTKKVFWSVRHVANPVAKEGRTM